MLRFSHRGERETRVTRSDCYRSARDYGKEKNDRRRERPLYSHDRIERPSLRRVVFAPDQTRTRHSLQTINMTCDFQGGTKFVSSEHDTRMKFRRKKRAAILLDSVPHEDRHSVACESIRFFSALVSNLPLFGGREATTGNTLKTVSEVIKVT